MYYNNMARTASATLQFYDIKFPTADLLWYTICQYIFNGIII